jgi:hypothetical protein
MKGFCPGLDDYPLWSCPDLMVSLIRAVLFKSDFQSADERSHRFHFAIIL